MKLQSETLARNSILALLFLLFSVGAALSILSARTPNISQPDRDCWSIRSEQSTGTIRCYSGGRLVYQNSIYHNGGVLCAVSGKQIKITGGRSLCVIESWQANAWEPPAQPTQRRSK